MRPTRFAVAAFIAIVAAGCATTKTVNMTEARRVVGTEAGVRVDAQVFGDVLTSSSTIALNYDVTNQRETAIAIADLIPDASYDSETATVTINLGSEVPGEQLLPRLVVVPPGSKKSFSGAAHVNLLAPAGGNPLIKFPRALRLKLNFLGDTKPFEKLIGIPERAVHDPQLAAALFPTWVEGNESVITNTLPMRWNGAMDESPVPPPDVRTRRGRRPGG